MRTATADIDLSALRHNLGRLRQYCPGSKVFAVIKANAYGHGALPAARVLAPQADALAVARLSEALSLRAAGVSLPIVLLGGCFGAAELPLAAAQRLQPLIHNEQQLRELEQAQLPAPLRCWLKIDTGMHRLGVTPAQVAEFVARLQASANVEGDVGFMSHFCCADEPDNPMTLSQLACFNEATAAFPGDRALANSAGLLCWPQSHLDWVRPGIALYGISPLPERCGADHGLRPVMTLRSSLIAVRPHRGGDPVGYGGNWVAPADTRLGVVAMGYGDGYPRTAPNGTPVLVNGRKVPLVGRVSMDMLTVDLGPQASDQVGDEVILWGRGLPAEEVARHVGTIAYELVTRLTSRVRLEYQDAVCD